MIDQDDLPQRLDLAMLGELLRSIVFFRGRAQNLDNDDRIDHRMAETVVWIQISATANHAHVRIGGEPRGGHTDAEIRGVDLTGLATGAMVSNATTFAAIAACSREPTAIAQA
jgi:hypothetical protein